GIIVRHVGATTITLRRCYNWGRSRLSAATVLGLSVYCAVRPLCAQGITRYLGVSPKRTPDNWNGDESTNESIARLPPRLCGRFEVQALGRFAAACATRLIVIVFPPTGDRPGRNSVASVMVSGASCWPCTILFRQQNHTLAGRFSLRSPPKNPRRHE